jgi:cysteine-rich repeat protein
VCGDGILTSTCEVCDDGAGNSDAVADACRTDCRPARCGDGVTDDGEGCDDGNHVACDGCNEFCEIEAGIVCGDGVVAPFGCGEHCDDGNGDAGDGCSATCAIERATGGGSQTTDCWAAWRIDNASNQPRYDKRGNISGKQRCRDNDPACDFDGGTSGSCTFHVAVCVNNTGLPPCQPARLFSWELGLPSEAQALVSPALAAVRAALTSAVVPNVVGSGDANSCSPDADVVVPLRGAPGEYRFGKLKLKSTATVYSEATDKDTLLLRCDP